MVYLNVQTIQIGIKLMILKYYILIELFRLILNSKYKKNMFLTVRLL